MSDNATSIGEVTLMNVRLAFPDLYEPTAMKEGQQKQYGSTFLIEQGSKTDKAVRATIEKVAKAKWGDDYEDTLEMLEDDTQLFCYISGDHKKKKKLDGFSGNMALSAKNKLRPPVLDAKGSPTTADDGIVYAGCYVNAKVEIWAQDNQHGKAIRANLLGVVFNAKGDAFGGGRVADVDDLADLATGEDENDDLLG